MAENSKIEWCDHTFNPWIGCTRVSPGCAHCYAETQDKFRGWTPDGWGAGKPRKRTSEAYWRDPVKWNQLAGEEALAARDARLAYRRPRVFCASLADWLDDEVQIEWLADLLDLIRRTPNLDWLLLTKRPENWRWRMMRAQGHLEAQVDFMLGEACRKKQTAFWISEWLNGNAPENVWSGATAEDQERFNLRVPALYKIPGVKFLSCEPLLGPIDFGIRKHNGWDIHLAGGEETQWGIDWVICGGESGPGARPMHLDWARGLRDQCAAINVPFLFKQWGDWLAWDNWTSDLSLKYPNDLHNRFETKVWNDSFWESAGDEEANENEGRHIVSRVGKKAAGRLLDGIERNAFPEVRS